MWLDVDRRALFLGIAALAALAPRVAARPLKSARKVLLVCQFGTVKSAIARELLKRRAAQRGIVLSVQSRGITPEPHLPPELRDLLASEGIVPDRVAVTRLAPADVRWADLVILFDPLPAGFRPSATRDWTGVPSIIRDYARARVDLDRRIDKLLDDLASGR